jgi:type II secretory pathway pseudopilin PulG
MKNGFTLIESVLALSLAGAGTTLLLAHQSDESKKTEALIFANQVTSIINAVDHRVAIDGYDPLLWSKTSWSNEEDIVKNLISKDLVSVNSNCGGGSWVPTVASEAKTKLTECNLWKNRKNIDMSMSANMNLDTVGFIQSFDLIFKIIDDKDFEDYFINIKRGLANVKANPNKEIAGLHTYNLISLSTLLDITASECFNNPSDCAFKASFNRSGGNEYLRVDGENSMIGSHISFVDTKGNSPLKCVRWENTNRDGTGTWTQKSDEDCGVGIYNKTPVAVEVTADTGTFKNVVLDKECVVYEWNGSNIIDNGKRSPCGMTNNGTEIYQTVENTIANTATFSELYAETAEINIAKISEIQTALLNAEVVNINKELKVDGESAFNGIVNVNNDLKVSGETKTKDLTVTNNTNVKNLVATGDTKLNNLTTTGNSNLNNVTIKNLTVTGDTKLNTLNISEDLIIGGDIKGSFGDLEERFKEYDNKFVEVNNKIKTNENNIHNNKVDISKLDKRVTKNERDIAILFTEMNKPDPEPPTLDGKALCEAKSDTFLGTVTRNESGRTYCKYSRYLTYSWDGKACQSSTKQIKQNCWRDHK